MDLGKWLKDRKKDVEKRWQNSTVLDAVSANTEADKARRAQQVAQGNPLSVNQQASQTYGSGLSAPVNRLKDLWQTDTQADAMKRLSQTGLSETYDQQQKRLTNQAVNTQSNRSGINQFARSGLSNVVNRVSKFPSDAGNLLAAASKSDILQNVPILGTVSKFDQATGNKGADFTQRKAKQLDQFTTNKLQQSQLGERKGENKTINMVGQLTTDLPLQAATGGYGSAVIGANMASSEYNKARDAGKSNDYALGVGVLQGGASALSEKIGMDKFLPGNGVTGNIATKAAKRFITEGAQEAQQQFTQNLITNKTYDPNQSLKEGVPQSAVMGGLAGAGMSPVLDLASNKLQAPPAVKQQVVQAKPVLQQTGIPAQPGSLRERIQVAKDTVTNTIASSITPMDQNGFVTVGRTPKNIHPDDQAVMDAYIAHTRGYGAKLSEAQATDLELTAMHIADRYGMGDVNTLPKQLATIFDKRLIQDNYVGPSGEPTAKTYGYVQPTKSSFFRPIGEVGSVPMDSPLLPLNKLAKDPLDSLKQEARKYKSAEEFKQALTSPEVHRGGMLPNSYLKTPKKLYRGVSSDGSGVGSAGEGLGLYTTTDKKTAMGYAKNGGKLLEMNPATDIPTNPLYFRNPDAVRSWVAGVAQKMGMRVPEFNEKVGIENLVNSLGHDGVAFDLGNGTAYAKYANNIGVTDGQTISKISSKTNGLRPKNGVLDNSRGNESGSSSILPRANNQEPSQLIDLKDNQSGSVQIPKVLTNISERIKNSSLVKNEGGYAKNPFYDKKNEVAKDLSPEQSDFINEYANMLKNMGQDNGVDINPMTGAKISNNVRTADTAGKAMTEADWFNEARKQIESGKGAYGASEDYKALAKATSVRTEMLKKQGKITPKDEGYWSTPIKGQPKTPIPEVKDTNGLTPMEGDKIEFDSILPDNDGKTKKGTATVRWSEPSIANASGKEMPGQWLGNGALDSNLPFTIVERNGKPIAPQVGKTDFKYKNETSNGTTQFNELTPNNSFQDINGERHPFQSDAKITIKNYDGTNETKTITVKDIGSQKYFNDQLVRYGERGEIMSVNVDQSPALSTQKVGSKTKSPKPPVQDLPSISTRIATSKQQVRTDQSLPGRPTIPTTDSSAVRSSNMAQDSPNIANDTTKGSPLTPENFAKTFGGTVKQAETTLEPTFNAATKTEKGPEANKLFEAMKEDIKITKARAEAQASGKELNFYAKKDANDRSVGIEQFNPDQHSIEAGFVVDKKGNVLGNHIKVDANGMQVNVGGKVVNMDSIIGNPLDWGSAGKIDKTFKGRYKLSETMNRNIDNNAPTPEIATQTKHFLWNNKVKAEANMRTELETEYKALGDRIKTTNKARPSNVSKAQWKDDIFSVLNGDKTDAQIQSSYDKKSASAILDYKAQTRSLYDNLLTRVNKERIKFGQSEITPRKDYITHLQELNGSKSFVADVYGTMKNSFADEGMGKTRNGVPGEIAGRTEGFKPISKYNPFLQRRTGTKSLRDPYQAVQEYLQPALYNIHMTESGARARAVESAFRTAEAIKNTDAPKLLKEADGIFKKYSKSSDNSKLITGFQEYANALTGKTQRFDRQLIDASDASAKGLKAWQGLQRTGGRATILGNVSSTLQQPLNQVIGLADAGPVNYMKGIAAAVSNDPAIDKSDFIRARETEATKPLRTKGEKVLDAGGVPLQAVELASVKLMWHTQHQKALSQGMTGQSAIQEADLNTERLVAGRGIADKPEVYRSTLAGGLIQYTLEVNAQNKAFWQDLSPKQKATFMVASTATNMLMGAITGFQPLPDFLKALFDTGKDFLDGDNEDSILKKSAKGAQRMVAEYGSMNPLVSGPVNALLSDGTKKTIFGADSDLGRFPGGTAPVAVVKNAVDAGSSLAKGDFRNARDSALKVVPFGNQIRKTTQGVETLKRGYAVDKSGKKTFDAPTSPFQQARTAVFGPSASKQATEYYNKKDSSGGSSKSSIKGDTNTGKFSDIAQNAFNSTEGKAFMALKNDTERKDFARQSAGNREIYDNYQAMQKAYNGGDKLLAPGLDKTSTDTLNKYDRLTTAGKEKLVNRKTDAEYEYELASYNNKKANGEINLIERINSEQKLNNLKATKGFEKGYRDVYKGLSKAEVYDLITTNPDGQKIADQLLAIDDALVAVGNKSKYRDKYGNVDFNPEKAGARGSKSAGSKAQNEINSLTSSTMSNLSSLLSGVSKPVTGARKVAVKKATLKKITVKK